MRPEALHADEGPLDPAVLEQAADWLLRLGDRTVNDAERDACERWRRQDPEHARAWARAERLLGLLATVPAAVARPALDRPARLDRRAALRHLGVLALLAPGGCIAWRLWDQTTWDATVRTAVGERRHVRLPDGSGIELDTGSVLDIAFGAQQRLLRVREGQALFTTAPDPQRPARPFRVATAHGRMQALGTRFNVRVEPTHTQLAVLEGAVQVEPDGQAGHARRIDAGQQVWFDRHGFGPMQDADARAIAWHRGMFAADALPLGRLLEELARYRRGMLRCDPMVASLPVSGAFPLDDTDRSLAMLAATYPITVERRAGGWWTTVAPRRH